MATLVTTDLPDLELSLPASPDNVGVVRHVLGGVGEALDLSPDLVDDMRLAVSEACANVVVHAYLGEGGLMDIGVVARAAELHVTVRDHGTGMAPRTDSPGLGVGLPLIASLTSSMELVTPAGGGTEVRMRFPLPNALPTRPREHESSQEVDRRSDAADGRNRRR